MEFHARDRRCVTILLPPGTEISTGGVRLLVRYAQRRCGAAPWGRLRVEEYRQDAGTEALFIVRPAAVCTAALADYALPVVHKYFTD